MALVQTPFVSAEQINALCSYEKIVENQNVYYRCVEQHISGTDFDISKFVKLPEIPGRIIAQIAIIPAKNKNQGEEFCVKTGFNVVM